MRPARRIGDRGEPRRRRAVRASPVENQPHRPPAQRHPPNPIGRPVRSWGTRWPARIRPRRRTAPRPPRAGSVTLSEHPRRRRRVRSAGDADAVVQPRGPSRDGGRRRARGDRPRPSTDSFDIVLLDVALGAGPDGYEVCRTLRGRAQRGADHHAHRARLRGRRGAGARGRRRRLRHQAVRAGRAAQPHPRGAAARRHARAWATRSSSSGRSRSTAPSAR